MIGIYKITNPNGKIYIGQSINIEKRFYRYSIISANVNKQTKLYRSFLKYGVDNHKFEIVEQCGCHELNKKERHYQEFYNCVNDGLNCYYTSTNDKTGSPSLETLKRMSEAQKGNQHWLGKKHTKEAKDKISKANTGKKHSDIVNLSKGKRWLRQTKAEIRDHLRAERLKRKKRRLQKSQTCRNFHRCVTVNSKVLKKHKVKQSAGRRTI